MIKEQLRSVHYSFYMLYHEINERKTVFSLIRKNDIYTSIEPSNYLTTETELTNLKPIFTRAVTNSLTCHHLSESIQLLNYMSYIQ